MNSRFERSSPVGCVIGLFWLMGFIFDLLLLYASYKAYNHTPKETVLAKELLEKAIYLSLFLSLFLIPTIKRCLSSGPQKYDTALH